jgi:hypothetical protein
MLRRAVLPMFAVAILGSIVMPRAAFAQQCAVAQVGQLCVGGAGACVRAARLCDGLARVVSTPAD